MSRRIWVTILLLSGLCVITDPASSHPQQKIDRSLELLANLQQAVSSGDLQQADQEVAKLLEAITDSGTPLVANDQATFVVFASAEAESVQIIGSFDEEKGDITLDLVQVGNLGVWVSEYPVRSDAEFIYNLNIDGQFTEDPLCKRWLIGFGKHSICRMPDFDPWVDRAILANSPMGRVEAFDIEPKALEGLRKIQVYLPPGYDDTDHRYPVLYIHDGHDAFKDGRLHRIADYLLSEQKIRPLILCFMPPQNRMSEYGSKAPAHAEFLIDAVVPEVDSRYRTQSSPAGRGITGASMGGRVSTYLALHHSDVFSMCICQSAYFEENSQILLDLKNSSAPPVRFYFDVGVFEHSVGDRDLVTINRELRDLLKSKGCEVVYREWPGVHCWLMWSRGIGEALPLMLPPSFP